MENRVSIMFSVQYLCFPSGFQKASLVAQMVKNPPAPSGGGYPAVVVWAVAVCSACTRPPPPWGRVGKKKKNPPAMQETQVQSLAREDPLKKEMAIHSSILA